MKKLSEEEITEKIISFCNYRERSSKEVLKKLFSLESNYKFSKKILNQLIKVNLINDLRFSKSFCRGKFKINKWGKIKIRYHLIKKGIMEYEIKDGLNSINSNEYNDTIKDLLIKKKKNLNIKKNKVLKQKLFSYLSQKGYEQNLILKHVNNSIS